MKTSLYSNFAKLFLALSVGMKKNNSSVIFFYMFGALSPVSWCPVPVSWCPVPCELMRYDKVSTIYTSQACQHLHELSPVSSAWWKTKQKHANSILQIKIIQVLGQFLLILFWFSRLLSEIFSLSHSIMINLKYLVDTNYMLTEIHFNPAIFLTNQKHSGLFNMFNNVNL